jgi:ABC-type transport system involved in multi-copper enzyme maturation permease subunit
VITLLRTEVRRLWSRRLLKGLGSLVVLAVAAGAAITFLNSSRDLGATSRQMLAQRRDMIASCMRGDLEVPAQPNGRSNRRAACKRYIGDGAVGDPRWHYTKLRDVVLGASPILGILSLLLGASFVGAEWQRGTITTALTWEPRRIRLLVTKFAAVALVGVAFVVFSEAVLAGALWPVATSRGSTAGVTAGWIRSLVDTSLRVAAVGGLTAIVGCALATVGRNTTAALGVAFVYFAVLEGIIRGFRPGWRTWLLGDNAAQFIAGTTDQGLAKSDAEVVATLLLYAVALVAIATAFFKGRDVA